MYTRKTIPEIKLNFHATEDTGVKVIIAKGIGSVRKYSVLFVQYTHKLCIFTNAIC